MIIEGKYYYLFIEKVELPGVEPGSKQAAKLVSTCLVFHWLSGTGW